MDLPRQIEVLERAIGRLGIRLLEEELPQEAHIDGGLCTVDGEQVLYLSPAAPPWRRVEVLIDALRRLPHRDIWLPPEIRQLVQGQSLVDSPVRLVASGEASHDPGAVEGDR